MISARPYLALQSLYPSRHRLSRPLFLLTLLTISGLFIFIHQFYYEFSYHDTLTNPHNNGSSDYRLDHFKKRRIQEGRGIQERDSRISDANDYDNHHLELSSILARVEDLKRIKLSISNELRILEQEKSKLQKEKSALETKSDKLVAQINNSRSQLKQLELDIFYNRRRKFEKLCDSDLISPIIFKPLAAKDLKHELGSDNHKNLYNFSEQHRTFHDYSSCSLTKEFKFHLIPRSLGNDLDILISEQKSSIDPSQIREIFLNHQHHTHSKDEACVLITLLETDHVINLNSSRNNLVVNLLPFGNWSDQLWADISNNAAVASPLFPDDTFRTGYDLLLPSVLNPASSYESILGSIPSLSPVERKYLASYFGQDHVRSRLTLAGETTAIQLSPLEKILRVIHRNSFDDLFLFLYNCGPNTNERCYEEIEKMIELSIFVIILPDIGFNLYDILYTALSRGTIPVIFGIDRSMLPFSQVIDWRRSALLLPAARLPEMHFILRSIDAIDLYDLKNHGRRIFENYLATAGQVFETMINLISLENFNYPPNPVRNVATLTHYPTEDVKFDYNCTSSVCIDASADPINSVIATEILGPREKGVTSPSFRRNFSMVLTSSYDLWNNVMYSPNHLYPSLPIDPLPPSEYKFYAINRGFRPIGDGLGGSGYEFSRAIGGEYPNEQFTVVLLTYERKNMLMKTLERLKKMPYMNKILVIWNGVKHKPSPDMIWPDVGVPIVVVKVEQNSLNNRFLPYDAIETDAILSIDDDSPLRQDEIVFAFKVWRQSRNRIVGFPARYHAWDSSQNSWLYNSNHSCEISMVLTGGAFFHKYYTYVYSYDMPSAIRQLVDKFMNCEDIAMNFLVAHLTRKPPIKVTSRWTFHCPACQSSLSEDESHFRERHECLNTFASIYGYMPLLTTQHRSDSVLFKTRLPPSKQKCFRYV